ncbi:3TM-type holin [bacterium]|nr:3TM-type holin [bacterium]
MSKLLNFLSGGVVKQVGDVIDNLSTSEEERLEAKRKMEEVLMQAESQAQEQVTRRWEADMKSDNWLSKNIRPLICIFLTAIFVVLSVFDGNAGGFEIQESYIPIYQTLLITVYGAYFAGRSIEKIKKN